MPVGSALLAGPVFLLLIAKVPKHGPMTIVGIITGLIFFVTGMHWTMCVAYAVFGVGADLIVGAGKFKNIWLNILAYMLYSLAAIFPYVMFFFSRESYMSYLLPKEPIRLISTRWRKPVRIGFFQLSSLVLCWFLS